MGLIIGRTSPGRPLSTSPGAGSRGAGRGTVFAGLNATHPPFDSVARAGPGQLRRGPGAHRRPARRSPRVGAHVSATIPGFPSYRRYCPYTAAPVHGDRHGPDLATARRLVAESDRRRPCYRRRPRRRHQPPVGGLPRGGSPRALVRRRRAAAPLHRRQPVRLLRPGQSLRRGLRRGRLPDYTRPSTFYDPLLRCVTPGSSQAYPLVHCDASTDDAAMLPWRCRRPTRAARWLRGRRFNARSSTRRPSSSGRH